MLQEIPFARARYSIEHMLVIIDAINQAIKSYNSTKFYNRMLEELRAPWQQLLL